MQFSAGGMMELLDPGGWAHTESAMETCGSTAGKRRLRMLVERRGLAAAWHPGLILSCMRSVRILS